MTDRPRTTTKTVREQLDTALSERVIVLDGAMGTMLQRRELQEEDFRGQRFTDHSHDLKGNFDVLVLTKPSVIAEIHAAFSTRVLTLLKRTRSTRMQLFKLTTVLSRSFTN